MCVRTWVNACFIVHVVWVCSNLRLNDRLTFCLFASIRALRTPAQKFAETRVTSTHVRTNCDGAVGCMHVVGRRQRRRRRWRWWPVSLIERCVDGQTAHDSHTATNIGDWVCVCVCLFICLNTETKSAWFCCSNLLKLIAWARNYCADELSAEECHLTWSKHEVCPCLYSSSRWIVCSMRS